MIRGSCLCGDIQYEIDQVVGPFELCHCSRCRKTSGSAFAAVFGVRNAEFRFRSGRERIRTFEVPRRNATAGYRTAFCGRCGSPVPDPDARTVWLEVPAGTLDTDPGLRPERHVHVHRESPWFEMADELPQLNASELEVLRRS